MMNGSNLYREIINFESFLAWNMSETKESNQIDAMQCDFATIWKKNFGLAENMVNMDVS